MAEKLTPQSNNVDSMFQKIGEKLGWFQYKDLDSAMKTLSDKKKHNKSRLRLKSKQGKENKPVLNLLQKEVGSREKLKDDRLKEIQVDSHKEHKEIPLRKSPASTDLTKENSSQDIYNTAPTSPLSQDSLKPRPCKTSNQANQKRDQEQELVEQPRKPLNHISQEVQNYDSRESSQSQDSQEKNSEQSSQSQKLYNMSVLAGQGDGDLFSILEDVGVPLVESTRIYSRQSIDVFGLSINEETGENDSYENLQIKQKDMIGKRNSDLYTTAMESQNDFYTVTDTATQTGKSLMHKNEKGDSANESISSEEGSLYEVKDVSIQTEPTTDRTVIQTDESLCKEFDKSLIISEHSEDLQKSISIEPEISGKSNLTPSIIEESQLVLRMDTQDSIPEVPVEPKKVQHSIHPSATKTGTKPKVKPTPKTKSSKSRILKNKINFSDSESGSEFTPVKATPSTLRKKHKLYTPSNESFLCPSLDDTLSQSMVKSRLKRTSFEKSICQPNAVESYSEMMPKLSEKLGTQPANIPEPKGTPVVRDIPIMKPLRVEEYLHDNEEISHSPMVCNNEHASDIERNNSVVDEDVFESENESNLLKNDEEDSSNIFQDSPKREGTPPLISEDESALFSDISITASSKPDSPPKVSTSIETNSYANSSHSIESSSHQNSPEYNLPSIDTRTLVSPGITLNSPTPSSGTSPSWTASHQINPATCSKDSKSTPSPCIESSVPKTSAMISPPKRKPSSAIKPKQSSATMHTTSARKVAKMKALFSSSDSEEEMLTPEVTKSKYFTPKPRSGKKSSVSDNSKSKYFTPKSQAEAGGSDSDDCLTNLDLERYKVTIEQPLSSWRAISESSDDDFDQFLESVKPQAKPVKEVLEKSLSEFIVDDDEISTSGSDLESEEEIFISIQSPKNKGCTIVSPVSKRYSPSVVDVNKPHRLKTPTSTLLSTPHTSHTDTLKTPSTSHINKLKTPHISHAATRPYSTTSTELFKTPLRPKDITTPKVRSFSDKPTVHDKHIKCSFLKSLTTELDDSRRHPDSIKYIKQFKKNYEELTARLFKLYNETIFDKKLPEDMSITWNKRLLRTAGYCAYKRCHGKHVARIELSTKVCDNSERVRDTLIHELCHAAVWMLNQRTDGHGPYWKYWARKSNLSHPELPIISRCHNYSITTKYTYTCTQCGYQVGRHSKSLDTTKKVCGHCHGRFELMGTPGSKEGTPRTPNKFALFVKENYGSAKKTNSDFKHKEIMQLLSQQFADKTKLDS